DWLRGVGAEFVHLSLDGQVVGSHGSPGPDLVAVRRAQATAIDGPIGVKVGQHLIGTKIAGERAVLRRFRPAEADLLEPNLVGDAPSIEIVREIESMAARTYWAALAPLPLTFARRGAGRISKHWRTIGPRASLISGRSTRASSPAHAVLNFCF